MSELLPNDDSYIRANVEEVKREIRLACERAGREDGVRLVAVTKSATDEELIALCRMGISEIGENRPQELARRGDLLAAHGLFPALHEIGNLQKNKVRLIAPKVSLIHSLDNLSLAAEIARQAEKLGRRIPVLVEINSAKEAQKGGVMPEDAEAFCEKVAKDERLALCGLMTMGPVLEDAEGYRPYFRRTKELLDRIADRFAIEDPILSMGMSDSFAVAVEEGATIVRVGRRLFQKG